MISTSNFRVIASTVAVLIGGMFCLSIIAEALTPGSAAATLTAIAYGGAIALALPVVGIAAIGFMRLVWRQAEASHFILEVPTKSGPKYVAHLPADKKAILLVLSDEEMHGVELGADPKKPHRVRWTPAERSLYVRAKMPVPTPLRSNDLLNSFFGQREGDRK